MTILEFSSERTDDGLVTLTLSGELDIASAPQVEDELGRLEADAPPVLVLDLRGLEFIDSTGLHVVISADARAHEQDRRLVVVKGADPVHRVFTVMRVDERLEMVDDPATLGA